MSGYVVADREALVMQKVGTNVKYKVTKDEFAYKSLLAKLTPNIVLAPISTSCVLNHDLRKRLDVY